jgi:aryl-alcohol dehydrogenase-like predicted oxidoreductase
MDTRNPALGGIRLVLGGNVFGWTADQDTSFSILDTFFEAGGRMVDTADMYSAWVPGHKGGESETVLGAWMKARGNRKEMRIATKLNGANQPGGLAPEKIAASLEASLKRLQTDYVDLYYAHRDDTQTPLDVIAGGFDAQVRAGKVRDLLRTRLSRTNTTCLCADSTKGRCAISARRKASLRCPITDWLLAS